MSDTLTQVDTPSRNSRARAWCLTINNYTTQDLQLFEHLKNLDTVTHLTYGLEVGASGTKHIQAVINYKNAVYFSAMVKKFPTAHIEVCKNLHASMTYCKKDGEFAEKKPEGRKVPLPKDPLEGKTLRPFQKEILELLEKSGDDRTIHWFWEPSGNVGKTTLTKHIMLTHDAILLSGKASDCKYTVSSWIDTNKRFPKVIVFHFARSNEQYISYEAIEAVKDGMFMNTKYECKMCLYDPPIVIIMANFEPQLDALSMDRWQIKKIEQ